MRLFNMPSFARYWGGPAIVKLDMPSTPGTRALSPVAVTTPPPAGQPVVSQQPMQLIQPVKYVTGRNWF